MPRRASVLLLAALLASAAGCRNTCGDRHGLFTSNTRSEPPCTLVGSGGRAQAPLEGCFDPITGRPVPCPPAATVIPGGTFPLPPGGTIPGRPDELPFPGAGDMIPRPGVPFAPPTPAPGEGLGLNPKGGTPVRTGTKQ